MSFENILEGEEQTGPEDSVKQRWAWLGAMVGAEALAIGAVILAVAIAFALVGGTWAVPIVLILPNEGVEGIPFWLVQPRLVASGAATVLGLAGLYRARPDSATWVRPVAGAAVVVGLVVAAATALSLQTVPISVRGVRTAVETGPEISVSGRIARRGKNLPEVLAQYRPDDLHSAHE